VGWQPSRFLTDRTEAERAFQLAEQLGSVNAAVQELGTTWPSLRKPPSGTASACRHATPRPSASAPSPPPASAWPTGHPGPGSGVCGPQPGRPPGRERPAAELYQWVRRDEEYATLGANVVVELHSESHARWPTSRAWAIIRRAERVHRNPNHRQCRAERRQADRSSRSDRISRSHQPEERRMVADAR
jgi:hypothetical protein